MDSKKFNEILKNRLRKIEETLSSKAVEYAKGDRLYNFKRASNILQSTPQEALLGMMAKHIVSVLDLIEGTLNPSPEMIDEKIGDTINYLILLEAVLLDQNAYDEMPI
jgi:hypothetical protein